MRNIDEDFIHFIWQHRYFDHSNLSTIRGQRLDIIRPGYSNHNSGPDFQEARIRLDGVEWMGHVEIHKRSSDWYAHNHHLDKGYDSVILHVVLKIDRNVCRTDGSHIPQLELKDRIPQSAYDAFTSLKSAPDRIPCRNLVHRVSHFEKTLAQERMFVERVLDKSKRIMGELDKHKGDWDLVFWKMLCAGFGLKVNQEGFSQLAERVPVSIIRRNRDSPLRIEALLFGCAGMLYGKAQDEYHEKLKLEFEFLRHKYRLNTMIPVVWKFHRMRPVNFPTVRIAQLAHLINTVGIESNSRVYKSPPNALRKRLGEGTNPYWSSHYRFGKESPLKSKNPGAEFINTLFANVVAPFQYTLATERGDWEAQSEVLDMLTRVDGEKNRVTREFEALKFATRSMADTQSLLQLFNNYCTLKRCVHCPIGKNILSYETKSP